MDLDGIESAKGEVTRSADPGGRPPPGSPPGSANAEHRPIGTSSVSGPERTQPALPMGLGYVEGITSST